MAVAGPARSSSKGSLNLNQRRTHDHDVALDTTDGFPTKPPAINRLRLGS